MKWMGVALMLAILATGPVHAGIFTKKSRQAEEVPGGHPQQLVTTNGVVVPSWASKRIQESPVPLYSKSWGRRPWALALSSQATPSAVWARAQQTGFGAGPVPGYTNDYGGAGNYPMASVGKDEVNGWGPRPGIRNLFMPNNYPLVTGINGY